MYGRMNPSSLRRDRHPLSVRRLMKEESWPSVCCASCVFRYVTIGLQHLAKDKWSFYAAMFVSLCSQLDQMKDVGAQTSLDCDQPVRQRWMILEKR